MRSFVAGLIGILASGGLLFITEKPSDGLLHAYFLNVGQGDSILISTPHGKNILIDGGPGTRVLDELDEILKNTKRVIDYIILTHPDRDHIEGLITVLEHIEVKNILLTGAYKNDYFSKRFFYLIKKNKIPVTLLHDEADFTVDEVFLDILYPFSTLVGPAEEGTNGTSIILKAIYGPHELLLTGDTTSLEEIELLTSGVQLDSDILKVAHHGSKTSSSEEFIRAVSPEYSVISVGKYNSYHHPHPSVVNRLRAHGTKIMRTDLQGRIEFVFDKEKVLAVKTKPSS